MRLASAELAGMDSAVAPQPRQGLQRGRRMEQHRIGVDVAAAAGKHREVQRGVPQGGLGRGAPRRSCSDGPRRHALAIHNQAPVSPTRVPSGAQADRIVSERAGFGAPVVMVAESLK